MLSRLYIYVCPTYTTVLSEVIAAIILCILIFRATEVLNMLSVYCYYYLIILSY